MHIEDDWPSNAPPTSYTVIVHGRHVHPDSKTARDEAMYRAKLDAYTSLSRGWELRRVPYMDGRGPQFPWRVVVLLLIGIGFIAYAFTH